jgi:hypothetical protein
LWLSTFVEQWMRATDFSIYSFTLIFTIIVFAAATQDIAVDGLAITLIPLNKRGLCSTVQTVGLQIGFFLSFTCFLAFNSLDFCNNYLRGTPQSEPLISLAGYLWTWGWIFIIFTIYIAVFVREPTPSEKVHSPAAVYSQLLAVARLGPVQRLAAVLITAKIGFILFDAVTLLKVSFTVYLFSSCDKIHTVCYIVDGERLRTARHRAVCADRLPTTAGHRRVRVATRVRLATAGAVSHRLHCAIGERRRRLSTRLSLSDRAADDAVVRRCHARLAALLVRLEHYVCVTGRVLCAHLRRAHWRLISHAAQHRVEPRRHALEAADFEQRRRVDERRRRRLLRRRAPLAPLRTGILPLWHRSTADAAAIGAARRVARRLVSQRRLNSGVCLFCFLCFISPSIDSKTMVL